MDILIATSNPGKPREYQALLSELNLTFLSLRDVNVNLDVPEPYETFTENAEHKAREYAKLTGIDYADRRQRPRGRCLGRASRRVFGALRARHGCGSLYQTA